jgi:hypothetical protein
LRSISVFAASSRASSLANSPSRAKNGALFSPSQVAASSANSASDPRAAWSSFRIAFARARAQAPHARLVALAHRVGERLRVRDRGLPERAAQVPREHALGLAFADQVLQGLQLGEQRGPSSPGAHGSSTAQALAAMRASCSTSA